MRRRNFLVTPLAGFQLAAGSLEKSMYAFGDGIPHTPEEYAQLLAGLAKSGKLTSDEYSRGGVVETLEARMASLLGKEAAVWLPTGTLANHLAVRLLAGDRRRVLVQAEAIFLTTAATALKHSAVCIWYRSGRTG
jgi:threonine aldolase